MRHGLVVSLNIGEAGNAGPDARRVAARFKRIKTLTPFVADTLRAGGEKGNDAVVAIAGRHQPKQVAAAVRIGAGDVILQNRFIDRLFGLIR